MPLLDVIVILQRDSQVGGSPNAFVMIMEQLGRRLYSWRDGRPISVLVPENPMAQKKVMQRVTAPELESEVPEDVLAWGGRDVKTNTRCPPRRC